MRVAIVHDYLNQFGGAERVLEALHELFPEAPVYTILYDRKALPQYSGWDIRPSFIQAIPFAKQRYTALAPFFPSAVRSLRLDGFDIIISNTHAWGKGIEIDKRTCHICYCLTPMRYIWDLYEEYRAHEYINPLARYILPFWAKRTRRWDVERAKTVQHYIAISGTVADRIGRYYKRDAAIIYPPCDTDFFTPDGVNESDYYLTVSRLKAYKRIDLIIDTFNRLGLPLKIIGAGPELKRLKGRAEKNIEFLGYVSDQDLLRHYRGCRALVFAGHEDFGLAMAEAQACGKPVVAYGRGGAAEIVVDRETGILFHEQTSTAIAEAVERFQNTGFDTGRIRQSSLRFGKDMFRNAFTHFIYEKAGGSLRGS